MLSIILSACLTSNAHECRDFKIQVDFQMPDKYCTMAAQPVIAQWAGEHPQWTIKRWTCEPTNREKI